MQVAVIWHKPRRFWHRPRYSLGEDIVIAGHKVPAGFTSDGATIPGFLLWPFSPMGPWAPAAWLHDYLLSKGYPRRVAARRFYTAMGELEIWPPVRWCFYLGVRAWDRVVEVF